MEPDNWGGPGLHNFPFKGTPDIRFHVKTVGLEETNILLESLEPRPGPTLKTQNKAYVQVLVHVGVSFCFAVPLFGCFFFLGNPKER